MVLNNSSVGVKSLNTELQKAINQVATVAKLIEGLAERLNGVDVIVEAQKQKQEHLNDLQMTFQEELQKLLSDLKIAEERLDMLES